MHSKTVIDNNSMDILQLDREVSKIYKKILEGESKAEEIAVNVHPDYRLSAKNLFRYLILRSFDLRQIQDGLSELGVSSLRTGEGYVYSNLHSVLKILKLLQSIPFDDNYKIEAVGFEKSRQNLQNHANKLFNENLDSHFTEIMVTLPDSAAEDSELVKSMVLNGMEIARVNLSHGNSQIWAQFVENIKKVSAETRKNIKIYMDLSGPKIRTANIEIINKKGKVKNSIKIKAGDLIVLTKRITDGKESRYSKKGEQIEKAEIGVMLHEIIDDVQVGDNVYFDDGMIKATVTSKAPENVELKITECYKAKLSSNNGINLPNTLLNLPALTRRDIELLPFVCQHADIVGYSFVRRAEDVKILFQELEKNNADNLGVVFKIENQEAFENLPLILLEGMKRNKIGVMIARGDLAVEIGFERISEVQNEILWFCEAAHVPVIWATQVLDNLAKTGVATRAEISDASQSAQAECVMLNKGKYILDAIRVLKNILIKIESHTSKRKSTSRALSIAKNTLGRL